MSKNFCIENNESVFGDVYALEVMLNTEHYPIEITSDMVAFFEHEFTSPVTKLSQDAAYEYGFDYSVDMNQFLCLLEFCENVMEDSPDMLIWSDFYDFNK